MSLLDGSTVMLLTLIWGTCMIVGKCGLHDTIAVNNQDTNAFSGNGITIFLFDLSFSLLYRKLKQNTIRFPVFKNDESSSLNARRSHRWIAKAVTYIISQLSDENKLLRGEINVIDGHKKRLPTTPYGSGPTRRRSRKACDDAIC